MEGGRPTPPHGGAGSAAVAARPSPPATWGQGICVTYTGGGRRGDPAGGNARRGPGGPLHGVAHSGPLGPELGAAQENNSGDPDRLVLGPVTAVPPPVPRPRCPSTHMGTGGGGRGRCPWRLLGALGAPAVARTR